MRRRRRREATGRGSGDHERTKQNAITTSVFKFRHCAQIKKLFKDIFTTEPIIFRIQAGKRVQKNYSEIERKTFLKKRNNAQYSYDVVLVLSSVIIRHGVCTIYKVPGQHS